jgi:hypothetical protein
MLSPDSADGETPPPACGSCDDPRIPCEHPASEGEGPNQEVSDEDGEPMSDQPESQSPETHAPLDGDGDGIEITTSEPNTFEPEEDPDAAEG